MLQTSCGLPLYSRLSSILALTFALLTLPCLGQQPRVLAPHKPVDPRDPISKIRLNPAVPRSMIGGFWMIDANRKASIYLKNGLETSAITVTPVLFLSNGKRYALDPVTLDPSGTSVISINNGLEHQGVAPWGILSGYVEINYSWPWDPLCVSVTSVDPMHSTIFTTGFQPSVVPSLPVRAPKIVDGLNTVEGLWWKPTADVTGFVALSNGSAQPAEAKVKISDENNIQIGEQNVHLSPHGTKIVQLSEMQSFPVGATGGLVIQYTGPATSMLLNGGLEDQESGFSANLPFHFFAIPEPTQSTTETYAELGLMTGAADPMMSFPNGITFTPFSVVRNVGDVPVTVTPSSYWMLGGSAVSSRQSPFTVAPFASVALDVPSLLAKAGLGSFSGSVNLILEAQGPSRSLLLASGSVDAKNNYVFQVLPRGVQESAYKSISYWSTGNGDDTMVTVWNPADEPQDFVFTLYFTGGHYGQPIHLGPRATQTFNISEIIQNQIPDAQGNTIPLAVREGSAKLSGMQASNEQILVALDAGTYNVRKATCSYYCISCGGEVYAYVDGGTIIPFNVGVQSQFNLHYQYNDGSQYYTNGGSWSSTYTNVATVGTSNGMGTGMSHGWTTFSDYFEGPIYNSNYCGIDPFCPYAGQLGGVGSELVAPTVSFSNINYVIVGQTATTTATVTPSNNSSPISLSISSPAAVVSPTGTFTTNTNVVVKGLTVGQATLSATMPNPEGGSALPLGSTSFAVTTAAPTATITQNTFGAYTGDDGAGPNYTNKVGTSNLGMFANNTRFNGCGIGFETVGTISPSNYTGTIKIHRTIVTDQAWINSSENKPAEEPPGYNDTSLDFVQDENPQSGTSKGKVYDLDAPGQHPPSIDGNTYRMRVNFSTYAVLPDGTAISPTYNFYVRLSCKLTSSGFQFVNDVAGDNQIGTGTTKTSSNLQ